MAQHRGSQDLARPLSLTLDPHAPYPPLSPSEAPTPLSTMSLSPSESLSIEGEKGSVASEDLIDTTSASSSRSQFEEPTTNALPHSPIPSSQFAHSIEQQDPFDNTSTFAEDPFSQRSGSSSSGEEEHRNAPTSTDTCSKGVFSPSPIQLHSVDDPVLIDTATTMNERIGTEADNLIGSQPHPGFNRTFSAPLPNRLGYLRHPLTSPASAFSPHEKSTRPLTNPISRTTDSPSTANDELKTPLSTLSIELADTLQSAIQTLLHLSPPHLLDNAKEQYSGCTIQMPTTSLSALLTSMRGLNYLSANVQALCMDDEQLDPSLLLVGHRRVADFDIGELVQNVADHLSGQAAQAAVDLVLSHGDAGIRHTSVNGDAEGLGYVLGHILRQILLVADEGDVVEFGLHIIPQSPSMTPRIHSPHTAADIEDRRNSDAHSDQSGSSDRTPVTRPAGGSDGQLLCIFNIVHNIAQHPGSAGTTPKAEISPFTNLAEQRTAAEPKLDSILCRRLLAQQQATLKQDAQPSSPLGRGKPRRAYEVTVLLPRGSPIVEPPVLSVEEQAVRQPFKTVKLAQEPTLQQLSEFAESLRGKKVYLHARLKSVFARHLTSYLTVWGLDVSHIPIEDGEGPLETGDRPAGVTGFGASQGLWSGNLYKTSIAEEASVPLIAPSDRGVNRFIMIDDDVAVLRRELIRMHAGVHPIYLKPRLSRRPTLLSRTRSTPHIWQTSGLARPNIPVLIHFTSLFNYNRVRDVVTSLFGPSSMAGDRAFAHPDIMVVPKPVGPRRFLTTLHTAVHQPVVDPFFSPIATSPRSPGGGFFSGVKSPLGSDGLHEGFFDARTEEKLGGEGLQVVPEGTTSQNGRSPMSEHPPDLHQTEPGLRLSLPSPNGHVAPTVATPASEYFANKTTAASGLVYQSPDGRPVGMYFQPPVKSERKLSISNRAVPDIARRTSQSRRIHGGGTGPDEINSQVPSASNSPKTTRRASVMSSASGVSENLGSGSLARGPLQPDEVTRSLNLSSMTARNNLRRKTLPANSTEPYIALGRDRSSTITQGSRRNTPHPSPNLPSPHETSGALPNRSSKDSLSQKEGKRDATPPKSDTPRQKKAAKGDVVVPPINVLIVEDNPINQNILSMFLRKKKIKHQSAKDGLEAVEKWRTGGFHLILMDIQLPVMDGIEATKEIRKLERSNNIGILPSTPIGDFTRQISESAVPPSSPFRSSVIIVALTASSLQSDRVVALAAGCNDFLTKPVSLKWLERKIVEWGCMQALIDFDGWRKWKGSNYQGSNETKRGFTIGPQQAARSLAGRLRIERKTGSGSPSGRKVEPQPQVNVGSVTQDVTSQSNETPDTATNEALSSINEDA